MSSLGETEFGGKPQKNGVQPSPHIPTASEQLMLMYRTGDPSGRSPVDLNGDIWLGLREESVQRAAREAEGAFAKGQIAEELRIAAEAALAELAQESAVET